VYAVTTLLSESAAFQFGAFFISLRKKRWSTVILTKASKKTHHYSY
jgi:hypothetical protein